MSNRESALFALLHASNRLSPRNIFCFAKFALLFFGLFSFSGNLHGQDSYRTQLAHSRGAIPLKGDSQYPKSTHPTPPPRFRGWKLAQRGGPEVLAGFEKPRRTSKGASRISAGVLPTHVQHHNDIGQALLAFQAAQSSVSLPGISLRPSLPAGRLPSAIVQGDFSGDGKTDWVVANGGDNSLFIYLGNGDGTSQLPVIIHTIGTSPVALAVADLNGDGKLDLVVVEADTSTVGILLGKGDGTFGAEIELPALPFAPLSVAIADVNKDGKLDLIVGVSASLTTGPFVVMLGDGTGRFGAPIPTLNGNGLNNQSADAVSVADVNADGILDILATGFDTAGGTSQIYIGKGDGSFTAGQILEAGAAAGGFFVDNGMLADVNGDGCPDGLVGDNASVVHVYPGDCRGHFDNTSNYQTYGMGDPVFGMAVADLNGDGHPDLITGGFPFQPGAGTGAMAGNLVGVRLNDGTGHFGSLKVYAGDPGMFSVVVADLKNNGRPEILTANQNTDSATVYQNDGAGGFGEPLGGYAGKLDGGKTDTANPAETEFVLADVNGDGLPDIVQIQVPVGGFKSGVPCLVAVLLNQGNGNFASAVRTNLFDSFDLIGDFILADFRKTGKLDFLAAISNASNNSQPAFAFAPNIGNAQFGSVSIIPTPTQSFGTIISGIGVGDFNHDGNLDFLSVAQNGSQGNTFSILMYLGNGDGTFRQSSQTLTGPVANPSSLSSPISPAPVFVEDANRDGKLDLLVWFPQSGEILEFLGNGDGTFQPPTTILQNVQEMTVADLNHDGLLDIIQLDGGAYATHQRTTISIYLGRPDGSFSGPTTYTPYLGSQAEFSTSQFKSSSTGLFGQLVGDFNGDGNPDLAVFQTEFATSSRYVQFMMGNGDGTFTSTADAFPLGEKDIPVLAVRNLLGNASTVFLNEDDYSASYHIRPTAPAPSFQIEMDEKPVLNLQDALHIQLNAVSSSDTVFQLTASDPAVQIAAGATIPAGQPSVDVPFMIGSSFNLQKVFSITVQSGTETEIAYNFVTAATVPSGFQASVSPSPSNSIAPGSITTEMGVIVSSLGEATAAFLAVGCLDLPATVTCQFQEPSFLVPPGSHGSVAISISTNPSIAPGSYPFRVQITDGVETFFPTGILSIGDFTLSLSPAILAVPSNGVANFTYTIGSLFNYRAQVNLSCSNLPSGTSCQPSFAFPGSSGTLQITLNQAPPGNYTFTLTGTSETVSHTATAQLQLLAIPTAVLSQSQLNFPSLLVGATSTASQITLQNTGSAALSIQNVVALTNQSSSGSFSETNNCGASLAVNASCILNVTFSASSVGNASGSLQLTDNAADSPQTISLTASGVDFSISAANGSSTSITIPAGQTASYNLQIQPNQFQGVILLSCSGAPSEAVCSTTPSQVGITNVGSPTFQVQVSTTARSSSSAPPGPIQFDGRRPGLPPILTLAFIVFLGSLLQKIRRQGRASLAALIFGSVMLVVGCGGGSGAGGPGGGNPGTPSGTYILVVTGQGDGGKRTINLTLIVQ